jgi:ATP-binding cassette, subfamily B, bacterial
MEIGAGEIVALVGENGSGKTTLAKLLCRLYLPHGGRILWDGVDTATADPDGLRRSVAVIFQDFLHYSLPASENIGMGRHQRIDDAEAIRGAALHAGADDFLARLPDGYETLLGPEFQGGKELSVGQWQRVALARASSATPRSSSWTSRPRPWTPGPSTSCSRASGSCAGAGRCC